MCLRHPVREDIFIFYVHPITFGVSFLHSYGITFMWDHIHMGSHSYRRTAYCIWSFIESQSHVSIVLVSFSTELRNVAKETLGTRKKRPRVLDHRLRFEIEETTLRMQ